MLPVLAMLAFAGQAPAVAAPPPAVAHVFDFRLASDRGDQRAFLDMNLTAPVPETGDLVTRVYWIPRTDDPVLLVADITVNCATRQFTWGYTEAFDRTFQALANRILPFGSNETPDAGSTADETITFICASRSFQAQKPYLGSEWKSATRIVDPRFR